MAPEQANACPDLDARCDVYALGGVTLSNLHHFRDEPLAGIAAISLWMIDEPLESALEAVRAL